MSDSLRPTPGTVRHKASLSFTISRTLLRLMCTEWVMPSDHLILYHPFLLLPSMFPIIRVFSIESALHIGWPKYWNFSIGPSSDYSRLISFRDWLVWAPCSSRDSQESSPAPQFKSMNSLALSLFYGPTLTSIHNWKSHSFDYIDLCQQSDICFIMHCLGLSSLSFQGAS